jgi:DNA repair protein RadD
VTGDTPKHERDSILRRLKEGTLRAVSNNKVLTVGLDIPNIDLIADMNPTLSAGLFIQKLGRGARPVYAPGHNLDTAESRLHAIASSSKINCVLLDFANNLPRFGCIDKIKAKAPTEGDGVAPIKDCPGDLPDGTKCCTILPASARTCHACGFVFPEPKLKIAPTATNHAVLSTQIERQYRKVMSVKYHRHDKKGAKVPTLRVAYMVEGFTQVSEWVCLEHFGGAKQKALNWWKRRAEGVLATLPVPATVDESMGLVCALKVPSEIVTMKSGAYDEIVGYKFTDGAEIPASVNAHAETYMQKMDNESKELVWDDDIAF